MLMGRRDMSKPTVILVFALLLVIELYRVAAHEWPQAVEGTMQDLQWSQTVARCKKGDLQVIAPNRLLWPPCTMEAHCRRV